MAKKFWPVMLVLASAMTVMSCGLFACPFNGEWDGGDSVFVLNNGRWEEFTGGQLMARGRSRFDEGPARSFIMEPTHFMHDSGRMVNRRGMRRLISRELPFETRFMPGRRNFIDGMVDQAFVAHFGNFDFHDDDFIIIIRGGPRLIKR